MIRIDFPFPSHLPEPMKKTLLSVASLLVALTTIGCQPAATTTDVSTDTAAPAADSNVTATAETPAMTETPAATEAPAAEEPAAK